ncbi:MAG: lipopolysaccharide biosynthesis protein [Roseiflexaceae bacterium]
MTLYQWLKTHRQQILAPVGPNTSNALIRALVAGMTAAVSGLFLSRLLSTIAQILIVRELGPERNGEYGTIVASLGLLASFLGWGLDTWLLKSIGRSPDELPRYVWNVILLKLIGTALLLTTLLLAWSSNTVRTPVFFVGAIGIIFDGFSQTCYSALRATRRNGQVAFFQTLSPLLLVLVLLVFSASSVSVLLLISVQATCSMLICSTLLVRLWREYGPLPQQSFQLLSVVRAAWLFVAADVLANIYSQSATVILGNMVSQAAVGIFKPALTMMSLTFLIPNLLFSVSLPLLSAPNMTRPAYLNLLRTISLGAVLYGLAAWAGLFFLSEPLIRIVLGRAFDGAGPLVQTLSIVPLLKTASFVFAAVMLSYNQQRLRVLMQCIVVATMLPAGLLLIPAYAVSGAVWVVIGIEVMLCSLYGLCAAWLLRRPLP